jgi:galactose mutarotase-like enzyme
MRTLVLENRQLRLVSLLDKGSDIIELVYKPLDVDVLFHAPTEYRKPGSLTGTSSRSDGAFMEYYGGGWQDILPFAGNETIKHRFGEWGMHGETPLLPWEAIIEKDSPSEVTAKLAVNIPRYPFRVEKWITLDDKSASIRIRERVVNTSSQTLEYCWLHHPTLGRPLIAPGTKVTVPAEKVVIDKPEPWGRLKAETSYKWPHAEDKAGHPVDLSILPSDETVADETVFLTDFKEPWYTVVNPKLKLGFALRWDPSVFRHIWFWQSYRIPDHPWFGKAYCIALEPCTGYPGASEQLKRGTIKTLQGDGSIETNLTATLFAGIENTKTVNSDGTIISN